MHRLRRIGIFITLIVTTLGAFAEDEHYLMEFGALAGGSYYVGEASPHVFMHIRPAYGGYFRYKFDKRWNFTAKALYTDIKFDYQEINLSNHYVHIDASAEYNFLPYGIAKYDSRIKTYTPFMYVGLGGTLHNNMSKVGIYVPFGIGFKWNFARHGHLSILWQHQLYFSDDIEGVELFDNHNDLNGWNVLNNDWFSTFVMSLSFDFLTKVKTCKQCGVKGKYAF